MQTRRHLTILALLFAALTAAPLGAHEGHKQDMSDEEMMMEASSSGATAAAGTGVSFDGPARDVPPPGG